MWQNVQQQHKFNTQNVSFQISLRRPIHIINLADKTKLSCYTPHLYTITKIFILHGKCYIQEPGPVLYQASAVVGFLSTITYTRFKVHLIHTIYIKLP